MNLKKATESFEKWYAAEYAWEIKRCSRGNQGKHLTKHEDVYISNHARDNFKVWCAALSLLGENK